jgi:hypothetical protein
VNRLRQLARQVGVADAPCRQRALFQVKSHLQFGFTIYGRRIAGNRNAWTGSVLAAIQSAALSIRRVLPMNTARAMCVPRVTLFTGTSVAGSKNSM